VAIGTMRLGKIAHNFWGLIGSIVAAVLPTTREIFEPTVRLYGAVPRSCQGVNAVSWQTSSLARVRYGDDSRVDENDVIHIGRIDFRNDKRLRHQRRARSMSQGLRVLVLTSSACSDSMRTLSVVCVLVHSRRPDRSAARIVCRHEHASHRRAAPILSFAAHVALDNRAFECVS
jgi:hypothetical protein